MNRKVRHVLILLLGMHSAMSFAQSDSIKKFTFSGYGELYYGYDFSQPRHHEKADFMYNHKLHNTLNVNLAMVSAKYAAKKWRGNLSLMAGNYAQYNLITEPIWAQYVYEANLGIKLSNKHNLWLDGGIMPSHIGFESAVSADCWTLTRSILAENSPYYETGVKLSFSNKSEQLNLGFVVLNGWQRIRTSTSYRQPSFGVQLNYKPREDLSFNYSNFIGTAKADSLMSFRIFHNLYLQYQVHKKLGAIVGFDVGTDKYNETNYGIWYSPVAIIRYALTERTNVALRSEYYHDKNQIVIASNTVNGFQVSGFSTNFDYKIMDKSIFRIEGKLYRSRDKIFANDSQGNFSLTSNLTIKI